MNSKPHLINLKSLSKDGIFDFVRKLGLPKYRAGQLIHWIYEKHASSIEEITEFSKDLRNTLNEHAYISNLTLVKSMKSSDGTEKFLFELEDGQKIESVLIPDKDRLTLCISSQVGCPLGCVFCLTGKLGLIRNLKSYEIVDQIISVNRILSRGAIPRRSLSPKGRKAGLPEGKEDFSLKRITNIVLMGMGEPLANLDEVIEALWRIVLFIGISKRKITLSTAGLVPKMRLLAEKAPEINLAVSLNAASDAVRNMIMPVNRSYPLRSLIEACKRFPLQPRRRITFEYILMEGINDSTEDAELLVKLLRGIRCKINLIPLNPQEGSGLRRPSDRRILEFQNVLIKNNMTALIRESKGQDILAACGQLRGV